MRKLAFQYAVSIAIGGGLVWLAFRGEDWDEFFARAAAMDLGFLTAYLLLYTMAHALRLWRWGILVRGLGPVPWKDLMAIGAVGYMCIMVLPLRLGEFVRPYLVRGKGGVTGSGAMATVLVERVIDGLLLVCMFFVFISLLPDSGHPAVSTVRASGWVAGIVFGGALLVLVLAYFWRRWTVAMLRAIGVKFHGPLTEKAVVLLESFLDGLKVLPDIRRIIFFMGSTVLYWGALGICMKLMGEASRMPDLSWTGAYALLAILTVGIMVPAGPGFSGTFELAVKAGLSLLVLSEESLANSAVYILVLHGTQFLIQVTFGGVYIFSGRVELAALTARGRLSKSGLASKVRGEP